MTIFCVRVWELALFKDVGRDPTSLFVVWVFLFGWMQFRNLKRMVVGKACPSCESVNTKRTTDSPLFQRLTV